MITVGAHEQEAASLQEQLAAFRALLTVLMVMASTCDESEIFRIVTKAIPSVGSCRVEGIYLDEDWRSVGAVDRPAGAECLEAQLASLDHSGGVLTVGQAGWAWAYPLTGVKQMAGHLLVSSDREPESHRQFLLGVLAQHAGVALFNARLHASERASTTGERKIADQLRSANLALEQAMAELTHSSAAVQHSMDIHDRLTAVASAGQGRDGIARCLYELTGLAVVIEDRHGNLITWAGPGQPEPYPKPSPVRRDQTLRRAVVARSPVRDRGRLIAVSQPGREILGIIALIDPRRKAGTSERIALEHANTVLSLELAHLQAASEIELRLRRDLVEDLLAGTDPDSAHERARALGYDLVRPHRVVVVSNGRQRINEAFFSTVRGAVLDTEIGSLLTGRSGEVIVLCHADQDWERFRARIMDRIGPQRSCRVAVGGPCVEPCEYPRSYRQARFALRMQVATGSPEQVTVFDDLGIYQLLSQIRDMSTVDEFIHRWLGILISYDATKDAQLVDTLAAYLERGGNYDLTAKALSLHRSTLRYRLQRIREMSGHELNDPDTRFHLQLATRAWTTVHALREPP